MLRRLGSAILLLLKMCWQQAFSAISRFSEGQKKRTAETLPLPLPPLSAEFGTVEIPGNWRTLSSRTLKPALLPCLTTCSNILLFFSCLLGPHLWHMDVPRRGVKSELQLSAYTTATATLDPSRVCNPHHSSCQCRILNPLREARNQTGVLMDTSWVCNHWAMKETLHTHFLNSRNTLPSTHQVLGKCN